MGWYTELANKLSHLLQRKRFDGSLDEEMRLHLETRVEELMSEGMTHRDAVLKARREFGPTARIAEESRAAWRWMWFEDLLRDLHYAARALRRDRGFALTAIISLALAIGVNTTIFSLTAEFLFSEPSVRDGATLMRANIGGGAQVPMREYRFLRDARVFEGLAGASEMQETNWRTNDASLRLFCSRVTENFFEVTGMPVALGRPFASGERSSTVVTHRFWQTRLNGDANVLGRSLLLDGQAYTIVGVFPPIHRTLLGFGYAPDLYLPITAEAGSVDLYGRLSGNATRGALAERLKAAASELDRIYPDANRKWANGVSVSRVAGFERLRMPVADMLSTFGLLLAVAGLLLLIACANVASLLLARGSTRMQEFAIRMSIGAGRGRVIRQMLAESLLLSFLGSAAGLTLNYWLTRLLNGAQFPVPFPLRMSIQPDVRLLIYSAAMAVLSALAAGLLPAFKSTRSGANALLKGGEHQVSRGRATVRNVLVTGQLAISVFVLIIAAFSIRNLMQSIKLDAGFDLKRTVWAQMRLVPESYPDAVQVRAMASSALDRLRALPGVESAAVAVFVPLNDHFVSRSSAVYTDGSMNGTRIEHWLNPVGPDYFRTMGIDLIAGREFTSADRDSGQRVIIINEAFARKTFGGANPVGHRVRLGRQDRQERVVIGVVRNSKYSSLGEENRPALFDPFFQKGGDRPAMQFLIKASGPPESLMKPLNRALMDVDGTASVEVKPMSRATGFALLPSRVGATLLGTIGLLGLALASVGLYGVLAYSISRRTREIGLRVALGAKPGDVLRLVMVEGAWILFLGLGIGVSLALLVTRPLAIYLVPGVSASDPITYAGAVAALMAVGCTASLLPALRALRIDPLAALRND